MQEPNKVHQEQPGFVKILTCPENPYIFVSSLRIVSFNHEIITFGFRACEEIQRKYFPQIRALVGGLPLIIIGVSVSSSVVDKLSINAGNTTGINLKPYLKLFIVPHRASYVFHDHLSCMVLNAKITGPCKQTYRHIRFPFTQNKLYQRRPLGRFYAVILLILTFG